MEELIKKLLLASQDEDTAKELKKFGIEPDQIEGYKDLKIPANLDEALKIKGVQSEFDRKLAKALATREENLKDKFNFVEKEQTTEEEEETNVKDPAIKAVLAQMKKMSDKLETFEKEKVQTTLAQKKSQVVENLKSKGIPSIYASAFDLEKDFEEQMETVQKQFDTDSGTILKDRKPGQKLPFPRTTGDAKPSKEEIAKIVG